MDTRKIDKPQKLKIKVDGTCPSLRIGYNQACDDWEEWLPSNPEIKHLLCKAGLSLEAIEKSAKAISKRLRGE